MSAINNTILVIDDNPADIHLLSEMLLQDGYQVAGALNGQDGFALALARPPKMILLDLHMPGMDGMATARLIKSVPQLQEVPILFLTGSTLLDHKLAAFSAGAVDYVTKPYSAAEVLARIRVHLRPAEPAAQPMRHAEPLGADTNAQTALQTPGQRMVSKACALIQKDLKHALAGAALAHAAGTNEKRLNEEFRSQLGLSVFEYLRRLRHQNACHLLLNSQLSMGDIALESGFKTAAAFTFSFRQQLGLTPSQYRAQAGVSVGADLGALTT